ncbi:hypothetical protein BE20_27200 [Sorangium cellulosum]|uniref:Uncharacterized protein n=1 Tax=Sorangium cellulosum TaxID=56 RepID=A0A150SCY4_SORCE|nr:hypothetical protein BE20_27200 [Sorangium cellulosum]KYF90292.1 hypothetical protein BE18_42735 [Sorangium cellulosum]
MDNDKPQNLTPSLTDLMGAMAAAQAAQEPFFLGRLRGHFGADPRALPVVAEEFPPSDHPNFQLAIETHLRDGGFTAELLGVSGGDMFRGVSLPDLVSPPPAIPGVGGAPPSLGPVQYRATSDSTRSASSPASPAASTSSATGTSASRCLCAARTTPGSAASSSPSR